MSKQKQIYRIIQNDSNVSKLGSFIKSNHVQQRKQQRCINDDMIKIALTYGLKDYSYGAVRFTLTDRTLSRSPYSTITDALRGLRVVCRTTETSTEIITTYWDTKIKQRTR